MDDKQILANRISSLQFVINYTILTVAKVADKKYRVFHLEYIIWISKR